MDRLCKTIICGTFNVSMHKLKMCDVLKKRCNCELFILLFTKNSIGCEPKTGKAYSSVKSDTACFPRVYSTLEHTML